MLCASHVHSGLSTRGLLAEMMPSATRDGTTLLRLEISEAVRGVESAVCRSIYAPAVHLRGFTDPAVQSGLGLGLMDI